MYISKNDTEAILQRAEGKLVEVIAEFVSLKKSGADMVGTCPHCKGEKKLTVSPSKQIFKCFACNQVQGNKAISWLMSIEKKTYNEALKWLADHFKIVLTEPEPRPIPTTPASKKGKYKADSFCAKMLAEYDHAFFTCDCGKEIVAHTFNNVLYKGSCECGAKWELKSGMIRRTDISEV